MIVHTKMTSLCIMKRGYNEIFSFPLACPIRNYEAVKSTLQRNVFTFARGHHIVYFGNVNDKSNLYKLVNTSYFIKIET